MSAFLICAFRLMYVSTWNKDDGGIYENASLSLRSLTTKRKRIIPMLYASLCNRLFMFMVEPQVSWEQL